MVVVSTKIDQIFWNLLEKKRGSIDFLTLKQYLIVLVFIKFLTEENKKDSNYKYFVPAGSDFDSLLNLLNTPDLGEEVNKCLRQIADINPDIQELTNYVDFTASSRDKSTSKFTETLSELMKFVHDFSESKEFQNDSNVSIYANLFDHIIYSFGEQSAKSALDTITPKAINDVLAAALNINSNKEKITIYDPACGFANSLITAANILENEVELFGQEMNSQTAFEAKINLIIHGFHNFQIERGNVLNDPKFIEGQFEVQKFDYVISAPPFSVKSWNDDANFDAFDRWNSNTCIPPNNNADYAFILQILASLKFGGKAATVISHGVLFRGGSECKIRKYLVDNGFIKGIIGLPSNLYVGTSIPSCILILEKNVKQENIFFIDASACFVKEGFKNIISPSDVDKILQSWSNKTEKKLFSKSVSIDVIVQNDYNLNIPRYIFEDQTPELELGYKLIKLGDLVSTVARNRTNLPEKGKFIRIRDLKDDNLEYSLALDNIENNEIPHNAQRIDASGLLIALRWKTIKPTYFNFTGESIYITNDIIALQIDESKIDLEYLIHELHSDYVLNEIDSYRTGNTVPLLKKSDLLQINIVLPSLEAEQKAKVKGAKEAFLQSKKKELELKQELLGIKDESFREFASIKHTFRQYLNALKSNVAGTGKFIVNNEGKNITLDMIYSKNLNKTLGQHLSSLEGTIQSMSRLLSSFEDTHSIDNSQENDLSHLVAEAQNRFKNTDVFKFEKVYVDTASFTMFDDTILAPKVSINEEDFYRVFSNIISNAMDHGFKDESHKYSIRTSIAFDNKEQVCVLEVSNNGLPMAKNFSLKHLTTRGEKTTDSKGSGMGGADIKNILNKYGGTLDVINLEQELFPVIYSIKLPYFFESKL
jgi:type I restriction enzyme M protein